LNNIKDEFIKAIMQSLKIEKNPFIYATIDEYIAHLKPTDYKSFMSELFGTQHQYLNGLDRVAKVAEQFKPQVLVDEFEEEAKRLIELAYSMNNAVFQDHIKTGRRFEELLELVKFPELSEHDYAVLNNVSPHNSLNVLLGNINTYTTSQTQLQAFIDALKFTPSGAIQIANVTERLRIKKG